MERYVVSPVVNMKIICLGFIAKVVDTQADDDGLAFCRTYPAAEKIAEDMNAMEKVNA